MLAWRFALLLSLAACSGPRVARRVASCPAADQLLRESARARDGGQLFRALAQAEAADRACSSDATRTALAGARRELWGPMGVQPTSADAEDVRAAAYLRLAGHPEQALAKLRPIGPRLDEAGLAELARAEAATGHAAEARRALERAAARAEKRAGQRGRWRWQKSGSEPIVRLAFSPDGTKLASADREGRIRVRDAAGGHELVSFESGSWPQSLAISPDGRWIIAAGRDGPIHVWSASSGKLVRDLPHEGPAAFAPDGNLIAATGGGMIELAIPSGQELARFGKTSPGQLVVGDRIYASHENASRQHVLSVWERGREHRRLDEVILPESPWALAVAGRELVITFGERTVIADERGKVRHALGKYASVAVGPDGKHLLVSPVEGGVDVLDLASRKMLRHVDLGPGSAALAFHPRGGVFAAAERGVISLRRLDTGEQTALLGEPTTGREVYFSVDGRRLALHSDSGPTVIWNLGDGTIADDRDRSSITWSASGVSLAWDSEETVATLDDGRAVSLEGQVRVAAVQAGGGLLAAAHEHGRIAVWDVATGQPRRILLDDSGAVVALGWSPGGRVLASAAGESVRLWDASNGMRLAVLEAHAAVAFVAFHPDGRTIAVACDDGLVELWAVATGRLVATLAAPATARGLVIAPDGAIDGKLADGDPLFWTAGGATLPARAVWDREATPGLLAARLAVVPSETVPRPGLAGAGGPPDPPACFERRPELGSARLISAEATGDDSLSLCLDHSSWNRKRPELPTCFHVDLSSGSYRPRPPAPNEVLERSDPPFVTAEIEGREVTVCKGGACREVIVPELARVPAERAHAIANAAASLVAVVLPKHHGGMDGGSSPEVAAVYDVARGRRISRVELGDAHVEAQFLDDMLLVTNTPCAGPCSSSALVNPRTGKQLAMVGGSDPINTSSLTPARVSGDVYAFNDNDSWAIVYQDIKTGRVVRRFDHEMTGCDDLDCRIQMLHVGGRLAVLQAGRGAGDIALYDTSGQRIAHHRLPVCEVP